MAEYWKSTPSYWCKFCSQYVRDTTIERKNHDTSAKHQNNIQRSLRELHKGQERERRDKQAAKDEVARLNGMFSGDGKESESKTPAKQPSAPGPRVSQPAAPAVSSAAQRKAHAEQLAAMGVELPEELKKEVTGVGNYQAVSVREVQPGANGAVAVNRSLADILAEARREEEIIKAVVKSEEDEEVNTKLGLKRKIEDDEDYRDEKAAPKRKAWGSDFKRYPGTKNEAEDTGDLDALLSGVAKKKEATVKAEKTEDGGLVKTEEEEDVPKPLAAVPDVSDATSSVKRGDGATPAVVFKKRKGKK